LTLYNTQEVAELADIPYKRLWYYLATGRLRESRRVGRVRLFNEHDASEIKEYFDRKDGREQNTDMR
jgi:DNA-binding transcriptional MerR regulator